ncbi:MAG: hypothetical protein CSB24_01035 [Deltaproteobacteria bacterium]|nr:MAG: hypothetical protein CSB24_01035 [Deltaproteobacteria bacterium]
MSKKKTGSSLLERAIRGENLDEAEIIYPDKNKLIFRGLLIIFIFFGIGGTWITLAEITGAVIANGEVRVDSERKTVQHLEGGIVRQILVRDGDRVEKGQPLIVLDSSKISPTIDQLNLQLMSLRLKYAQLESEKTLARQVDWPENNGLVMPEKYQELLDSASKVFLSNREALDNNVDLLKQQKQLLDRQDQSLKGRLDAENNVVKSLQVELDAKMPLFRKDYIDKTEILRIQRIIAERQGQIAALKGSRAELTERRSQIDLQIQSAIDQYRQQAVTGQEKARQMQFELEQRLLPLLDANKRLTITAPIAGEVVAMQVHSTGGVVRSGEPLLDIVPENSKLVIVCSIQVTDVTKVHAGQDADVQLPAFNQRTTPKIPGKVIYISADRIMQSTIQGQMPSYVVHVELEPEELRKENLVLGAGMPASVFIRTEPRTVLDYLLEPIMVNFDRALRES